MPYSVGPKNLGGYFACDVEQALMIARTLIERGVKNIEIIVYKEGETDLLSRFGLELQLMIGRKPVNDPH